MSLPPYRPRIDTPRPWAEAKLRAGSDALPYEDFTLDVDPTLSANSDAKIATQKAVKAYVDAGGGGGPATTDQLPEGVVNFYYHDSLARAALSYTGVGGTYNSTTGVITFAAPVVSVAGLTGTISSGDLKTALSLNNVDNTSDANKPVSTAQAIAIAAAQAASQPLDSDLTTIGGLTPANDDIIQRKSGAWTNRTIAQYKTDLAISNVDNTSDANKPVSTAQATAIGLKVSKAGDTMTGNLIVTGARIGIGTTNPLNALVVANGSGRGLEFSPGATIALAAYDRTGSVYLPMQYEATNHIFAQGPITPLLGQIIFPATQNPSSDPNTLDDYEEGTFTPEVRFDAGTTGITYTSRSGRYTKVGRLVTIEIQLVLSNKGSSTGQLNILVPFSSTNFVPGSTVVQNATGLTGIPSTIINGGAMFFYQNTTTGISPFTNTNATNTLDLYASVMFSV